MRQFILFSGLLCLAAAGPAPGSQNVHELMTEEETMQVFRTQPHAVPDYEVVPMLWPKQHKRSYGTPVPLQINAFGRNIKLWLKPAEGILAGQDTPVYFARSGSRFGRVQNPFARVGNLLEDLEHKATLMVTQSANGRNTFTGNVGSERWVVNPLPNRFNNQYRRYQRSVDYVDYLQNNSTEDNEPHYHVVYKQPEQDLKAEYAMMPVPEEFRGNQYRRSGVNVPDVIYPEVLVAADYKTYKLHGENLDAFLTYMLLFWNGVDLKYRSLESPKVRFNIAAIVIGQDSQALPFISNNVPRNNPDVCYIEKALSDFTTFMKQVERWFSKETYDIAIGLGPYKMCSAGSNNCGILGLAWIAQACKDSRTGMVMDMGTFDGVHTAAHEIAHLFGVQHDGTDNPQCREADGNIMSPTQIKTENTADWSTCSMRQFDAFFKGSSGSDPVCLFNKPHATNPLPRVLPGRLLSRDQQCEKIYGTKACGFGVEEKDICIQLPCYVKGSTTQCMTSIAPLDGTHCGPGKICLHGKCLPQSSIL